MGKKTNDKNNNTMRRSSAPNTANEEIRSSVSRSKTDEPKQSVNEIHQRDKKQHTKSLLERSDINEYSQSSDETQQSVKTKPAKFFDTIRKTLLSRKKSNEDNNDLNLLDTSSCDEKILEERESSNSDLSNDKLENIQSNKHGSKIINHNLSNKDREKIIDELIITNKITITHTINEISNKEEWNIVKSNSKALIEEQTDAIAKTGIIHTILKEIGKNPDDKPVHISYIKNSTKNKHDLSLKHCELINVNERGYEVLRHANFDEKELRTLLKNTEKNDDVALETEELTSARASLIALPIIDFHDDNNEIQQILIARGKAESPITDNNDDYSLDTTGETILEND